MANLQRLAAVFLALTFLVTAAQAQDNAGASPLEVRLIARRTTYPVAKEAAKFCFTAIDFELKNIGKEKLNLYLAPEPELVLTGPRAESVRKIGGHSFYVTQERGQPLMPGEVYRGTFRTLSYRVQTSQFHVQWLEPGDYTLQAVYAIAIVPQPAGAQKGANTKNAAMVTIKSAPFKLTVIDSDPVDYWTKALADKNLDVRRIALLNLRDMGPAALSAGDALVGLLPDENVDIRVKAINALEAIGPRLKPNATQALLQSLAEDNKPVKLAAIKALVQVASDKKEVGPATLKLLRDKDRDIRLAAAQAWHDMPYKGRRVDTRDTAALLKALKAETVKDVQHALLGALCHHPSLEVLDAMLPYLRSEDRHTKMHAIQVLGRQGAFLERDPKKSAALGNPVQQTVAILIDALKDKELLPQAAYALARIGPASAPAVPALLDALNAPENQHKDSIHHPRVTIVQALRDIGPGARAAGRVLAQRMLTDPDWSVRQYCAQSLGYIDADPREVGPALNQAFKDPMVQVRNEVARSLAKVGAITELLDGLNDDNPETRLSIIHAASDMKDHAKELIPALVKALHDDKHAPNRRAAAYALGSLKAVGATRDLAKALADMDGNVRLAAVDSLRGFGPAARAALPALMETAKNDKVRQNREKACWALVAVDIKGEKSFVPVVVELLTEKDAEFVAAAVYLAGQLGPDARDALPHLRRLAARNDYTAAAAREAMRKIEAR